MGDADDRAEPGDRHPGDHLAAHLQSLAGIAAAFPDSPVERASIVAGVAARFGPEAELDATDHPGVSAVATAAVADVGPGYGDSDEGYDYDTWDLGLDLD